MKQEDKGTMVNKFYTYVYLDPRKSGDFAYGDSEFNYEPIYVEAWIVRRNKNRKGVKI